MNKILAAITFLIVTFVMTDVGMGQNFNELSPFLNQVQTDSIRSHIKFLSHDRLLGRLPGAPGYKIAMDYVISRCKSMGLEPAGENNSFVQTVKLRRGKVDKNSSRAVLVTGSNSKDLLYGVDYTLLPNFEENNVKVAAQLVFVGYGVSESEFGYDDYAGVDVKGKIVVLLDGAPDKFPTTVRAHVMNRVTRVKTALSKGAIGVLVRPTPPAQPQTPLYSISGSVVAVDNMVKGLKFSGTVTSTFFNSLLGVSAEEISKIQQSLKEGKPNSFAINASLQVTVATKHEDFESYNVVGLMKGADNILKDEYVVYSAHLDHLGIGPSVKGDSIYNGAHDNASGVGCVLEIARLYTSLKQKPKRSLLFVWVTGEEMGLIGSSYFASHPTVPKEKIVADVNMDMPTLIAPLLSVVPLGAAHSSLILQVRSATAYLGVDVEDDPEPLQNRFTRSDQYSFVQQGIPALHIKYGDKTQVPGVKLSEKVATWRSEFYHQPQDEFKEVYFDFEAAKKYVQLCFLIGYQVAQENAKPSWNKGDLFGKKFAGLK